MEEYTIYTTSRSEIVKEPLPNAEWKLVRVYIESTYTIEVFLCKIGEKIFIKPSGLVCHNNGDPCPGANYGCHYCLSYRCLFECSSIHCKDLPKDRVIDVTRAIVPGKVAGILKILSQKGTVVRKMVGVEERQTISNWKRYLIPQNRESWFVLYARQDEKEYLKVCPDIVDNNGRIGYTNYVFEILFCWPMKWKNPDPEIVIDVTGLVIHI
jgi:hypothetical protein